MSIINDALKKTQMSFKKTDKVPEKEQEKEVNQSPPNIYEKLYKTQNNPQKIQPPGKEQIEQAPDRKTSNRRSAKKWIKIFTGVIFCLLCVSGSFFFIARYKPFQGFFHSLKKTNTPSRAYIARQMPKKRSYKTGDLVLNGTSLIDGKRVALINDEIYEIGEIVNGKKITSINLHKIELRDNEETITLRVY